MLNVTFLAHSGFLIDDGKRCYVFDYYKDPNNIVWQLAKRGRELWFFVSHTHGDHFNPSITEFDGPQTRYICHQDVPLEGKVKKCITMRPGQDATLDDVGIHMYGSTDEGGSFYVKTNTANIDSDSIFHAGDLNWWHWLGDTPENNADAKRMAWREFKELEGLSVDVAMFPVDNRLEDAMEWGSIEFLRRVQVNKAFIPMHLNGPLWTPSVYFKALFGDVLIWAPQKEGDECTF